MDLRGYDTKKMAGNEPPFETEEDLDQLHANLAATQAEVKRLQENYDRCLDTIRDALIEMNNGNINAAITALLKEATR